MQGAGRKKAARGGGSWLVGHRGHKPEKRKSRSSITVAWLVWGPNFLTSLNAETASSKAAGTAGTSAD